MYESEYRYAGTWPVGHVGFDAVPLLAVRLPEICHYHRDFECALGQSQCEKGLLQLFATNAFVTVFARQNRKIFQSNEAHALHRMSILFHGQAKTDMSTAMPTFAASLAAGICGLDSHLSFLGLIQ